MPSRADVDRLVDLNRTVRELVARDLKELWVSLADASDEALRDAIVAYLPVLVDQYGDITATVAADWYAEIRSAARAPGKFAPLLADNMKAEFVERGARTALAAVFDGDRAMALDRVTNVAGKYAAQSGRNTIVQSASRDPWKPRVARVPSGPTTCAFCLMLSSRGPVYASLETAGRFNKYHGKCDCQAVVVGPHQDLPEGYEPEALYLQYQDARAQADTNLAAGHGTEDGGNLSILQTMRRDGQGNIADAVHEH